MKLTKRIVDKAETPTEKDQVFYRDSELKGFALRVTKGGVKSFVVETLINNRVRRFTLGKYGRLTPEQARKEAKARLAEISNGINPIAEKKARRLRTVTLGEVFSDYVAARKSLKQSTVIDYQRALNQVMPEWLGRPLSTITRELVAKRHTEHGEQRSKARSNLAMRILRALFRFAINHYFTEDGKPIFTYNPVGTISHSRAWYKIERRQTVIKEHQLADWYKGITGLSNVMAHDRASMWQDYFLLVLFTGLRRQEALSLQWINVDLKSKTVSVLDTKNGDTHTLPMSDFLYELFLRRQKSASNEYVFPADSKTGHLIEPRKTMQKIAEISGVPFTIHDLRRTFITSAERLDIPAYALKRLLNHKMNYDITAGYIIADVERLRKPMEQITDHMLRCIGERETGTITQIVFQNRKTTS